MGTSSQEFVLDFNLKREFLERILGEPIISYEISDGSQAGDNFLSVLYSVKLTVRDDRQLSWIIKIFPAHPARQEFLMKTNCFLKELLMYKVFIPSVQAFQTQQLKCSALNKCQLQLPKFPGLVHGNSVDYDNLGNDIVTSNEFNDDPSSNYIIMIDARSEGFRMTDKFNGLNKAHTTLVMRDLARFHATTWAYKNHFKLPNMREKFPFLQDDFFTREKENIITMISANFNLVKGLIEKEPGLDLALKSFTNLESKFGEFINSYTSANGIRDEDFEAHFRVVPQYPNMDGNLEPWIVVNHGDCWVNNMLFRYKPDSLEPQQFLLLDLQISRECCPTIDLAYFLYTSVEPELRTTQKVELLRVYYDEFVNTCDLLQCDPLPGFTFENFQRRFNRAKLFGLSAAILVLPIILQQPGKHNMDAQQASENGHLTDLFKNVPRDAHDDQVLKDRFVSLIYELHLEGVL